MNKNILNQIIIMATDIVFLIAIFYLTIWIRSSLNGSSIPEFNPLLFKDFSFVLVIIFVLFYYEKIYSLRFDFWQDAFRVLKSLVLAFFIVLALLTLLKTSLEYSRLFITIYFILTMLLMPILKRQMKKLLYRFSYLKQRVLIVGDDKQVEIFKEEFRANWYLGMECHKEWYDTVIISSKDMELKKINKKIDKYLDKNSSVYVIPYVTDINFANSNIMEYTNIRFNTIEIENKLLIKRNIFVKRVLEILSMLLIFPLFIVLHLIIALVIKLDSKGKVFFKQHRLGKDDKDFVCYKYRTMYEDSDLLLKRYLEDNPDEVAYYDEYHKYKNDPRITKVGRFLRATSLDELAQTINVLKGDMSLVGPRPYMLNEYDKLGNHHHFILKVQPGITGLWQVSGRNNLTFKERNELEVWYIKNWSPWADFVIIVKTIKVVLLKVGAR